MDYKKSIDACRFRFIGDAPETAVWLVRRSDRPEGPPTHDRLQTIRIVDGILVVVARYI